MAGEIERNLKGGAPAATSLCNSTGPSSNTTGGSAGQARVRINPDAERQNMKQGRATVTAMTSANRPDRIIGVDICRSAAILLAMFSHAMVVFDVSSFWPGLDVLRFTLQMATPMFICLFGAMLEIAYGRKVQQGDSGVAIERLLTRALQCYVLYAIAIGARVVTGDYSVGFALRCLLFAGATPFVDILKFYALVLILAPAIIALRLRFGLFVVAAIAIGIHVIYPLQQEIPAPALVAGKDYLGMMTRFLIGTGHSIVGGPSLFHGISLVLFGMIIGRGVADLRGSSSDTQRRGWLILTAFAAGSFSAFFLLWDWNDSAGMMTNIISMALRNANHPVYFAVGLATTITWVSVCIYLFDFCKLRWADGITFIGKVSLFTFCFGNILLIVQPFTAQSAGQSAALAIIFGVLIALQSFIYARLTGGGKPLQGAVWSLAARIVAAITGMSDRIIAAMIAPFVPRYKRFVDNIVIPQHHLIRPAVT
ncbi:OpgC domain-containing protein [Croceicoccus sp. F390]|uniref:OpgC domain-containing protein n=1 Tax=Croceicoccus esteveae TaxID=3075597 RepID=A0ABU2ZJG6_9SPHN|nr:OpgC domain-containing protein [Croceicoccus sp. F390]MDT0576755.1 OpgC domain-containing protein [Croceicoccus sp. F390]